MNLEALTLPLKVDDSAFRSGLKAATAGITAAVAAIGVVVKATFDWADGLDSLQDVMGGTNKTAAALSFTLRKSGTNTDVLKNAMFNLSKGLVDANGNLDTTGKALQDWGVNVFDTNGVLKDQTTLLGDIADKYAGFATQQERVNFLSEAFGKPGKEMIDFFDTLAAEGGIDTVAEKVERLGLAIDPARYEQFNRNLEEMKLVGLGLAVGFTEQLMPAFESVSEWALTKGIPAMQGFASEIKTAFDEGGIIGVAEMLLGEIEDIDWGTVSTAIIDGISGIDWSQAGIDFSGFVSRVGESIGLELQEFDWLGVGNAMASGLNNFIAGALFGTDEAGLQTIVQTELENVRTKFETWSANLPSSLDALDAGVREKILTTLEDMATTTSSKLAENEEAWNTWSGSTLGTMATWGILFQGDMETTMTNLEKKVDDKLRSIAKAFFNRALAWGNQASNGFNQGIGVLIEAIRGIVNDINKELKRIITSFNISVNFGGVSQGTASTSSLGGGSTGGTGGGTQH